MSQHSTTSAFQPINPHDGDGDGKPKASTRLDKQVDSVQRLQSNADVLMKATTLVTEILDVLKPAPSFKGKKDAVAKLVSLETTLSIVRKNVASNAVVLSPIPSMAYVHSRKKRTVSPVTTETTLESIKAFNTNNDTQCQQQSKKKRTRTVSPTPKTTK